MLHGLLSAIKQWGYQAVHGDAEQEFSLPIAFTNNPYTVAISTTNTGNHAACKGFTLSTIILDAGDSVNVDDNIGFIILGKQQWGLSTGRTITYPISLLTLYSIVALDAASGMDAVQVCDVNTADNTNAIIFQMRLTQGDILPDNMTGFYWILIGRVQQWGIKLAESTEYPYLWAFPTSFASQNFGVFAINNEMTINNGAIGIYDVDTQSAKIALYGRDNDNAAFLFAIGQQQASLF